MVIGVEIGTRALPSYRALFNKLYHAIQQLDEGALFAELYCNNVLYNMLILPQAFQPALVRLRITLKKPSSLRTKLHNPVFIPMETKQTHTNPLKDEFNLNYIKRFSSYRAVNTFHLCYKNLSILCWEIMSLDYDNRIKYMNTFRMHFRRVGTVAKRAYYSFVMSVRLSAFIRVASTGRISVKCDTEDYYENLLGSSKFG